MCSLYFLLPRLAMLLSYPHCRQGLRHAAQEQQIDPSLTNKKAPYPAAYEVLPSRPVKPENPNDAQAVVKYAQAVSAYTKAAQAYIDGATNDVNDVVAKRNEAVNEANAVVDEYNQFADSYGKKGK